MFPEAQSRSRESAGSCAVVAEYFDAGCLSGQESGAGTDPARSLTEK